MEELAEQRPTLVVGVLGGSAGHHPGHLRAARPSRAGRGGWRCSGGRSSAPSRSCGLVARMPPVLRGELSPSDAVRAYHDGLAEDGVSPARTLEADLEVTDPVMRAE